MIRTQAQVDSLSFGGGRTSASGDVAKRLLQSGMNVEALRTNDVLQYRDWIAVDERVVQVARQRLGAVNDLFAAGLSYPIADALGVTRVEWERISDFGTAEVNMSGVAEGRSDRVDFDMNFLPLPIVHKDFNLNIRALASSRRSGHPLDLTQLDLATRIVAEKVEDILFHGLPSFGTLAGEVYGYTNAPDVNTAALGHDWTDTATTGENMLADLQAVILALNNKRYFGPYMVYVPNAAYLNLSADYKTYSDKTILSRLKEIPSVRDIRPSDTLGASEGIVVVQMTSDVVDIIDGIQPTVVEWPTHGGMVMNFKVMTILTPRMKSTIVDQSGIAYYTFP